MDENKSAKHNVKSIIKIIIAVVLGIIATVSLICYISDIHIFTFFIKSEEAARVDRIDDYYVTVYTLDACYYMENGEETLLTGYADDIKDYIWKHEELLGIVPFRRTLCFSKETEPEIYYLTSEDGTVSYGIMYVLRTSKDKIHYYYRRSNYDNKLKFSPILFNENITFSYGDTTYELKDYTYFSSDVDFTKNEHILKIENEPCYFN